jgi:CDP-glycerol glycerophosphotransferase
MIRFTKKIKKVPSFLIDIISKKLGLNIRHLFAYILSKLYSNRVNENLLVFGSTNGNAFSGNSKYLFLFLTQNSKYQCIWITSSNKVLKELENKNYNVISSRDIFKTIKTLKMAKYIFITHGFADILMIDFSPKTQLIRLEHGIVLKKLGMDIKELNLNIIKKKIRQKLIKSTNFMVATSEEDRKIKMLSFPLPLNKYIVSGYPRNDILVNYTNEEYLNIKKILDIEDFNRVLLYAPTYRKYKQRNPLNQDFYKKLELFLEKEKKVLLFKPHPSSEKVDLSHYNHIKSVDPNVDIMDLLVITDILITDYSGVTYDFLITMRPIIFFPYDLETYLMERGMYYDYETFVPGPIVKTAEELFIKLKEVSHWEKNYKEKRKNVRNLLNKYSDGNSTKRIIEFLDLKLS